MDKKHRLTRSADFQRVYRQGKSVAGRHMVLYYFERPTESPADPRLGLTVSKKIGVAVVRNRVKRVLKEAFHQFQEDVAPGYDYVIIARSGLAEYVEKSQFEAIVTAMAELFRRADLIQEAE
ncbi:MAG: ribonuclease P protein component [Thermoleophilia bacterium]